MLLKKNQIDLEIIFPTRGKIFDRNKVLIAKNEKVYDVYLIPENTKSINNTLNALSQFIDIDMQWYPMVAIAVCLNAKWLQLQFSYV